MLIFFISNSNDVKLYVTAPISKLGRKQRSQKIADSPRLYLKEIVASSDSYNSAEEKVAVMLEFAEFFYEDKPIGGTSAKAGAKPARPARRQPAAEAKKPAAETPPQAPPKPAKPAGATDDELAKQEQAILHTLEKLRQRLDPGQIDWGKAGYDFGEGFKGPEDRKR